MPSRPSEFTRRRPFNSVERSNLRYWFIVCLLLAVFATATMLLYITTREGLRDTSTFVLPASGAVVISLSGLVILFCLYMMQRQFDLARLRARLIHERIQVETLRGKLSELSALFEVGTAINLRLRLDGIIRIIVRRLPTCLGADRASLMIVNPSTGYLECRAAWGFESERAQDQKIKVGDGIAGWVAAHGKPLLLQGRQLGRFRAFAKVDQEITSAMSVPIKLKSVTIGVLNVTRVRSDAHFTRQHLRLLSSFARNVAGVIRKANVYEQLDARKILLEESNKELMSLNQMKEVFLATLSHELRSPLTCIVSFAELLDEKDQKLPPGERKKFVSIMHEQARKLMDLTEQLMDLSKLEKGVLELELGETDVNEVVHSAYVALEPTARGKSIDLKMELDLGLGTILADATKLRQIVLNLAGNAIKFTEEGGRVMVRTRASGEWVELSVEDTGIGLDGEEIGTIFGLFTQVSQSTHSSPRGLGLGLYLVKGFVDLHNGRVTVESVKGEGTTFKVYLPTRLEKAQEAPAMHRKLASSLTG
ncbi:MAG: GAF domain-containing sensor histidine kinase [Candidatus Eiseniibacteriota bacterium]|nr:MAG: GAF domain-containing sensor histidine kinase [Candidatus Eisenbacteria bacterium]